ncbi:uncharacterized protein V6R79_018597 [Siganus canaliculatus]
MFDSGVLFLAFWTCLAGLAHSEDRVQRSVEASRLASHRSKRLVGGALAPHVPWQAMIYLSEDVLSGGYAGGALISDRWVLTAGRNLFVRRSREDIRGKLPLIPKVYLGISDLAQANKSTEVVVEKIVLHPGFQNSSDWDNDLALIQLKEPVVINDQVTPIPLPERGQEPVGSGVITGWGWGNLLTQSKSLKHLVVPLASHSACREEYIQSQLTPSVDDNMLCTERTKLEENVCFGDAGGALVVRDAENGDVYAAGILSYDKACSNNQYGVYMKVSSYVPWIHKVMRGDTEKSSALRSDAMSKLYSW